MHARFQELIGLRDGEPVSVDAAQHVADCAQCSAELARLTRVRAELRQLPAFEPPPHGWADIQARLSPRPQAQKSRMRLPLAAAGVAATVALSLWFTRPAQTPDGEQARVGETLAPLVARSQQLEALLQELPARPSVERAATSATIDALQTRIQALDLQLSSTEARGLDRDRAQRLWDERVRLLNSLVSVRYAEAVRSGHWPAPSTGAI